MNDVKKIVHEMAELVRGSYGPRGKETLIFCPPEAPILTSSGYTIFHYADKSSCKKNPIKQLVMQTIRSLYREIGDGVTQFVLMLDLSLSEMQRHHDITLYTWACSFASLKESLIKLCNEIANEIIIPVKLEFNANTRKPCKELFNAAQCIVRTSLAGAFGSNAVEYLSNMVLDWVFRTVEGCLYLPQSSNEFKVAIAKILHKSKALIIQLQNGQLDKSRVAGHSEYLLRNPHYNRVYDQFGQSQRFVLLMGDLCDDMNLNITLQVKTNCDVKAALESSLWALEKFLLKLLHEYQVNLLLVTGNCPPHILDLCRRHGLCCFYYLEKDDVLELAERANIHYLVSINDPVSESNVGWNTGPLQTNRLGGILWTLFSCLKPTSAIVVPQLLLYGSCKSLTQQYYYAIRKALRVLCAWMDTGYSLPGGQAIERVLAQKLLSSKDKSTAVVVHALIGTWGILHENLTSSSQRTKGSRLLLEQLILPIDYQGCIYERKCLLETKELGRIESHCVYQGDGRNIGLVHPVQRTECILKYYLDTLQQLCRIDSIHTIRKQK
ncbi:hypothetical protein THRCLA_05792 [Thraustotheca clavata]|uniref:Uncharacterized protein n=1 Tax=Thraustotheca clavata TaxID=74557 RepID=A0A1V9ZSQ5_9STRA|nr:hypothetical protein THRCLA_05792 [Thraustotheca clavata]